MYQKGVILPSQPLTMIISSLEAKRQEIKLGLQEYNKGLNRGKQREKEYELFLQLGDTYLQDDILDYPKAAAIYQYLDKMLEKALLTENSEKSIVIKNRIILVEEKFIEQMNSKGIKNLSIKQYQKELEGIRNWVKQELPKIADLGIKEGELDEEELKVRGKRVEEIYRDIKNFFIGEQGLVKRLIDDCITQLGGLPQIIKDGKLKPCEYVVFGVGSMSIGTITPWSDLEFGILIEDGLSEQDEKVVKEYFRYLTTLLNIKVIKFGETPLRMVGVKELNNFKITERPDAEHNWFFDDLTSSGFSFDGPHWHACKTPLGRVPGYNKFIKNENGVEEAVLCKPYELIGTVSELMEFHNPERSWHKEDKELIQALGHIILMHGNEGLILEYRKQLEVGMHKEVAEKCAFEILKKNSEQLNPEKQIFDYEKEGQILNVKKDVYRFPDRVIVSFGDCLGERAEDSWTLIKQLVAKGKITIAGASNLELALSIAAEMRLGTYANNNGQKEDISALARYESKIKELQSEELTEGVFYLKDPKILYRYYCTVMPLAEITAKLIELAGLRNICKIKDFYTDDPTVKGYIYSRFLKYYDAIKEFERVKENSKLVLADLYYTVGRYEESLIYTKENLEMNRSIYKGDHVLVAALLNAIGNTLESLGRYEESLTYKEESLEMNCRIYKGDHANIARSLNNIGNTLELLGRYEESLTYRKESLEMKRRIFKGDHVSIAGSLNNVGTALGKLGEDEKAFIYLKEGLEMKRRIFKGDHVSIAISLNNIGVILASLSKYDEAFAYKKESLEMKRRIFKDDHASVADSLINVGSILQSLSKYEEAFVYFKESLEMNRRIFKGDHLSIAKPLNNLGVILKKLNRYEEALAYFKESLEIRLNFFKDDHADIAKSLNNLGLTLNFLGRYEEALAYFKQSTEMARRIFKGDHVSIAKPLNNAGITLKELGKYEEALTYYKESLEIMRNLFKNDHTSIAASLNNIGLILSSLGKHEEALTYYKEGLEMNRRIFKEDHANVADSLYNMGNTLSGLGRHKDALTHYQKSLGIRNHLFKGDHVDIAAALNNIGLTLAKLGRHKDALTYCEKSLKMKRGFFKDDNSNVADSLNNIGFILDSLERYEEAFTYKKESLEMKLRIFKGDHIEVADSLNNIGIAFTKLGRDEKALNYYKESLEMKCRIFKGNHAEIADSLHNIGVVLNKLGRREEALSYYKENLEMNRHIFKKDHIDIVKSLNNIANTWEKLGKYEEALIYKKENLEMLRRLFNSDHAYIVDSLNNVGNILKSLNKYEEALIYKKESLEMKCRIFKGDSTSIAISLNNLGSTLESLRRYEEALSYYKESLEMNRRIFKGDHTSVAHSLHNIGNTLDSLGRYEEALSYYKESLEMNRRIFKGDHTSVAHSLNDAGNTLESLRRYEEALSYYKESLEMNRRIFKGDYASIAISLNNTINLLEKLSKYEEALVYKLENLEMKFRINPENITIKHNLACYYHVKALKERGAGEEEKFREYFDKAKTMFEGIMNLHPQKASLYTEYAMFLLKHHAVDNIKESNKIKVLLEKAIELSSGESDLGFSQLDKDTTVKPLQNLLNKQNEVQINSKTLAYSLLINLYCLHKDEDNAAHTFEKFKIYTEVLEGTQESIIVQDLLNDALENLKQLGNELCYKVTIPLVDLATVTSSEQLAKITQHTDFNRGKLYQQVNNIVSHADINDQSLELGRLLSPIAPPMKFNIKGILGVIIPFSQMGRMPEYKGFSAIFSNNDIILRIFYYTCEDRAPDISLGSLRPLAALLKGFTENRLLTGTEQQGILGIT